MTYDHIVSAVFLERPNRFLAYALAGQTTVACHVKNTGRCRELLLPGACLALQYHPNAAAQGRKTHYSLIGVYKETAGGRQFVNLDSQAPNQVAWEWLKGRGLSPKKEVAYRSSRFDLAFEEGDARAFMEVKGVTLEQDGSALFPDAPTRRGVKHLEELAGAVQEGYHCYLLFVIAMKGVGSFQPNRRAQPEFAQALERAAAAGVKILAYDCLAAPSQLLLDQPVPVLL